MSRLEPGAAKDEASPALRRVQEWLASPDRLDGRAEAAHITRHGDCACLQDLWLPRRGGVSDIWALETCDVCGIRLYEAFENPDSRVRRQEDDVSAGPLPHVWAALLAYAFMQVPPGGEPPDNLVVCGCCWDTYAGEKE